MLDFYTIKLVEEYEIRLLSTENKLAGQFSNMDHNNCKEGEEDASIGKMR
jgi:hypothetical protein